MDLEEVQKAILILEKALKEGLLNTSNNSKKIKDLTKLNNTKSLFIKSSELSESSESNKKKTNKHKISSSASNKISSSASNKISSSASNKISSSASNKISSSASNKLSSLSNSDSEYSEMTKNSIPSEYFEQSIKKSDLDSIDSDTNYNLAMSCSNMFSGCSKDSDEIIDLTTIV